MKGSAYDEKVRGGAAKTRPRGRIEDKKHAATSMTGMRHSLARTVQERTAERSVGLYRGGRDPPLSRGHPNRGETTEQFRLHTLFGLTPLFSHDVWLHAGTAVIAAYFGWGPVDVRDEVVCPA